jgi:salicylate hydroxylase
MALEDAVVLTTLIDAAAAATVSTSKSTRDATIRDALDIFYDIRSKRTRIVRDKAQSNRDVFAMPPGPEQIRRDQQLRDEAEQMRREPAIQMPEGFAKDSANVMSDVSFRNMLYGYKADEEGRNVAAKLLDTRIVEQSGDGIGGDKIVGGKGIVSSQ